ncbi:hypothetical protein [Mycoplasma yeatsii]|uniref:hypothetical protein n=1 Tax=Mycoplasma yeatsii TaxID=51365 RepID=UPI0005B24D7B|nr:hypothetical protein [Mycoplasma yeatsii]AJM71554.1 hypothetical protein MYE_00285 [Mycoplasma yeatsii GM274B]
MLNIIVIIVIVLLLLTMLGLLVWILIDFIKYWKFRKIIKQAVIEYKIESLFHKILSKDIENNKSNDNE